jgi:hypothetical protein
MSLKDCIANALRDGEVSEAQAERLRAIIAEEEARAPAGGQAAAERRAFDRFEAEQTESARRSRLAIEAAERVRGQVLRQRTATPGGVKTDAAAALPNLVENMAPQAGESSVWSRYRQTLGKVHALMGEVILRFERDALSNTRNRAQLDNVGREAFGGDTGDHSARELAAAWTEGAEYLRQRRNAAGGNTGKIENWGLPQSWDAVEVGKVSFDDFRAAVVPELDRARMLDHATGRALDDETFEALLREAYDNIRTSGWSSREPRQGGGGMSLARQRGESRFFIFRDYDSWKRVATRFGNADPFAAMMEHVDRMAREIGAMEVLGPNPRAMLRFAAEVAKKEAAEGRAELTTLFDRLTPGRASDGAVSRVNAAARSAEAMYDIHIGTAYNPVDAKLARTVGSVGNIVVSSALGGAFLSALSDPVFKYLAKTFNGMSRDPIRGVLGAFAGTARRMDPRSTADKQLALQAGLIADGAAQVMQGQARYAGEFMAHGWSKRIADVTLRWSLLSPWTQAGKWAFGMETMADFGRRLSAGARWRDLPVEYRQMLTRYGIDPKGWAAMGRAELSDQGGVLRLTPDGIEAVDPDLARRYAEMIQVETAFAVPSATYRGQAALGNLQPGTFAGVIANSWRTFKSFPVTVLLLQQARYQTRMLAEIEAGRTPGQAAITAAQFAAYSALMLTGAGALSLQAKEISKGRDPRPMDTPEFWQAAFLQGGGLGIFGDFLFSDLNRFGGGLAGTVAGPQIDRAGSLIDLTVGNAAQAIAGEETNVGREALAFAAQNAPGSSIWYLRLAWERLFVDQLRRLIDPEAEAAFARTERRYARDYEQGYWWRPGDPMPNRPPDPGNIDGP